MTDTGEKAFDWANWCYAVSFSVYLLQLYLYVIGFKSMVYALFKSQVSWAAKVLHRQKLKPTKTITTIESKAFFKEM